MSSSFTAALTVTQLADGRWRTERAIDYFTDCQENELPLEVRCAACYSVPEGFVTDFASIPRLFWTVIGHPAGRYAQAAVLHDCLYSTGAAKRAEADRIFREAMAVLGVPGWQRWLMWAGVRIGGGLAYQSGEA